MPVVAAPSSTLEPLATGLAGASGCSYRPGCHDLVFVEVGGKLSRLALVRPVLETMSTGVAMLHGGSSFDFDDGAEVAADGDVSWEQHTGLVPVGDARLANVGAVSVTSVTPAVLQHLPYAAAPIEDANVLVEGHVFAVRTNGGNHARVEVVSHGRELELQWTTYSLAPAYQVLGTGYRHPEDVAVTADERCAYVTERTGDLLRVDLAGPNRNRSAAEVVCSDLSAPHQIFLDEARGHAYVVEFSPLGRLLRIDLVTGRPTAVLERLHKAIGLLLTSDLRFAYVTEQLPSGKGRLVRVELAGGRRETLAVSAAAPFFFLRWADASESRILMTECDPANAVWLVDLAQAPPAVEPVAVHVPFRPASVAAPTPGVLLCCSDAVVDAIDVRGDSVDDEAERTLLGIGFIPAAAIVDGYATTAPGEFLRVTDAPFGGSLPVMLDHDRAYAEGGRYYKVLVDGAEACASWSDRRWDNATARAVPTPARLSPTGFFSVRPPTELWLDRFLGCVLDTAMLSNGLHALEVRVYTSQAEASELLSLRDAIAIRVDNTLPTAAVDAVVTDGVPVDACAIIAGPDTSLGFVVTASAPEGHLESWYLRALWGNDGFEPIALDTYARHAGPDRAWPGVAGARVPATPWNADRGTFESTHCTHLFALDVWDRVVDGRSHIHHADFLRSIAVVKH
jgi:hypothetical protein